MAEDMSLSAETVRLIAQKARAVFEAVDDTFESGKEADMEFDPDSLCDPHRHDGLAEEDTDDLSAAELKEMIDELNVDETAELVALVWIGRGDFDASDFSQALDDARDRIQSKTKTSAYLAGMPHLADHLEGGLEALDL